MPVADYDIDGDGKLSQEEIDRLDAARASERKQVKSELQNRIVQIALGAAILVVLIAMTPLVPESRFVIVENPIMLFLAGMISIVGAYVGVSTWLDRK